jgi:hypothetical protein
MLHTVNMKDLGSSPKWPAKTHLIVFYYCVGHGRFSGHPDKMKEVGSTPTNTTKYWIQTRCRSGLQNFDVVGSIPTSSAKRKMNCRGLQHCLLNNWY